MLVQTDGVVEYIAYDVTLHELRDLGIYFDTVVISWFIYVVLFRCYLSKVGLPGNRELVFRFLFLALPGVTTYYSA